MKKAAVGVAIFVIVMVSALNAQTYQGRILGAVSDRNDALVPGAHAIVNNTATSVNRTVSTSRSGEYAAPDLEPGLYTATIGAPRFSRFQRTGLHFEVARDIRLDAMLQPGSVTSTVTDAGEVPTSVLRTRCWEVHFRTAPLTNRLCRDETSKICYAPARHTAHSQRRASYHHGHRQSRYRQFCQFTIERQLAMMKRLSCGDL